MWLSSKKPKPEPKPDLPSGKLQPVPDKMAVNVVGPDFHTRMRLVAVVLFPSGERRKQILNSNCHGSEESTVGPGEKKEPGRMMS